MQQYIGKYNELCKGKGYPSMCDFFQPARYSFQEEIACYLLSQKPHLASPGILKDVFTGERLSLQNCTYLDECYEWPSELAHYVLNYNLKLPQEFESHILDHLKKTA